MEPISSVTVARVGGMALLAFGIIAVMLIVRAVRNRRAIADAAREAALNSSAAGLRLYRQARAGAERTAEEIKRRAEK